MIPTEDDIARSLRSIRPFLQVDGGDVELVGVTPDGIVEVRLTGSCATCPMSVLTLRAGIERALLLEFDGIRRIEQIR